VPGFQTYVAGILGATTSGIGVFVDVYFVNAMLLNEVQKQRARIEDLEARLARLEALMASGNGDVEAEPR
jgi:hypothetical protein